MVEKWERDPSAENPIKESTSGKLLHSISAAQCSFANTVGSRMTQLCLEVATEEMERINCGEATTHDVSLFNFLQLGLDLEEQQCVSIEFPLAHAK